MLLKSAPEMSLLKLMLLIREAAVIRITPLQSASFTLLIFTPLIGVQSGGRISKVHCGNQSDKKTPVF